MTIAARVKVLILNSIAELELIADEESTRLEDLEYVMQVVLECWLTTHMIQEILNRPVPRFL